MSKFKVGDTVRQIEPGGPGEVGDEFPVERVRIDVQDVTYVYFPEPHGGGWDADRFEKVEPELPQVWQDKIEAALGRDALVTLGVVEPEPAFKIGDRVTYLRNGKVAEGVFGTVVAEVGNPYTFLVKWDNGISLSYDAKFLGEVETIKAPKQAIQVQFHVEAGLCPEARASDLRILTEAFLKGKCYSLRPDTKVTTQVYNYTETHEVLPGTQA